MIRRSDQSFQIANIDEAAARIASGGMVIVVDDPDRENEGDFVMGAEFVAPEAVTFMITHGRGLLCLPMAPDVADALALRPMAAAAPTPRGTAFTVSIDLASPAGSGISAQDRAACIRRAAAADAVAGEFRSPGHVFPLRARAGGVLERAGHTEAAVDLARLAGLRPAGAICEIMNDDGTMARLPQLAEIAAAHGLPIVTIADLIAYRMRRERLVHLVAEATIPTPDGPFRALCYESDVDGRQHLALVRGAPEGKRDVLYSVHGECLVADVFRGTRCTCRRRLREAIRAVAAAGEGVIVYVRSGGGLECGRADELTAAQIVADVRSREVAAAAPDLA